MSEYTPSIDELREAWLSAEFEERDSTTSDDDLRAEFDRALAAHDAEVRAGAWDSGYEAGAEDQAECEGHRYRDNPKMRERGFNHWRKNPHRTEPQPMEMVDDRDPDCVKAWPDCFTFGYDPACCRFPKSCSAGVVRMVPVEGDSAQSRVSAPVLGVTPHNHEQGGTDA